MSLDDVAYYRQRALEERQLAEAADSPEAAQAHAELARSYETLIERAALLPRTRAAASDDEAGRAA